MGTTTFSFDELSEDIGCIAVLGHEGDTKYTWDKKNPVEVQAAREHFKAMKAKGFFAFKIKRFGRKGATAKNFSEREAGYVYAPPAEPVTKFNPDEADKIIMTPPVAGG